MKNPRLSRPLAAPRFNAGMVPKSNGFTLVELLVVITIIIVLVALGFPMMKMFRQKGEATRCVSNLKMWGIAINMYASDNNGNCQWSDWPSIGSASRYYETSLGGDRLTGSAMMEGKKVYQTQLYRRCPAQKWDKKGNGPVGYAFVRPTPKIPSSGAYNLRTATNPGSLLLMIDATAPGFVLNGPADLLTAVAPLCQGNDSRHGHNANALFGDGHVGVYKWSDMDGDSEEEQAMLSQWFTLR